MKSEFLESCKIQYAEAEANGDKFAMGFVVAMANAYLDTLEWIKNDQSPKY